MNKLLFTGANGFLGKNILDILKKHYIVKTLDITGNSDYKCNLSMEIPNIIEEFNIILHAAGKAHSLPKSLEEEEIFYNINVNGTKNLCKGLENQKALYSIIFISSVAVYGCEVGENITEDYPLLGNSAYAKSKILAEEYLLNWCKNNKIVLTILRPSLLAGYYPQGNLGEMIKSLSLHKYFRIAGGKIKKSMAMATDIARIIPISEKIGGIYNLCDDHNPYFYEIEDLICKQLNRKSPINIPYIIAYILAKIGDLLGDKIPINSNRLKKITNNLTFSNTKLKKHLKFDPIDVLENFKIF